MKVIIMRGIPGSGKSTWIANNYKNALVFSADHYFTDENGEYKFDATKLGEAHAQCLFSFLMAITDKEIIERCPYVVIDNTNIKLWELSPYYSIANALGHEVEIVQLKVPPSLAASRCVHGVPPQKISQMASSMEQTPTSWNEIVINNN